MGAGGLYLRGQRIRAISLDVTGTLLVHRFPIMETYSRCAREARLGTDPPTADELKPAFKRAYKEMLLAEPCFAFGGNERAWWEKTVRRAVVLTGKTDFTDRDFNRFFRRVYQHYGSVEGYEVLEDARPFLTWAQEHKLVLGITTNTPQRTIECVLPMQNLAEQFSFFTCCQDIGKEKPAREIFHESFLQLKEAGAEDIEPNEVLHIGDSLAADFCGARAYGFSSLFLDRSRNDKVTVYQDWLTAPDYLGKSTQDIEMNTITSLDQVKDLLLIKKG